jgi:HK97 family phage major capsid protein
MDFKVKTDEEIKLLIKEENLDELAQYYNDLNAHKQKELESKIEAKADKEDIEKAMKEFSELKDTQMKNMNELLQLQGLEIKKLKEGEGEKILSKDEFEVEFLKQVEALKESQKGLGFITKKDKDGKIVKGKDGKPERLDFKAVGTMTFANSVTGTIPQADRDPGYNDFVKRQFTIRQFSNVGQTSANVVEWVYKAAKEGSAGMTTEGAAKTQLDWTYAVKSANVEKITSFVKISKEMLDDVPGMMAEINGELTYEINLLEETQLLTGNGVTPNIDGIEQYAQPLDNAGLAGTIATPNWWDVLGAAITQIRVEMLGKANANAIMLNPVDVFNLVHGSRTTTNEYNAPLAVVNPDGTFIHGVPVIESNAITAGEFLVGDFTKFHIRDREGLSIAIGYDSDDWTKNLVTILGEKRLVSFVKDNDVASFVTDTFSDGVTFLTAAT